MQRLSNVSEIRLIGYRATTTQNLTYYLKKFYDENNNMKRKLTALKGIKF